MMIATIMMTYRCLDGGRGEEGHDEGKDAHSEGRARHAGLKRAGALESWGCLAA